MKEIAPDFEIFLGKSMPITTPRGKSQIRNVIMIKPPLIINIEQSEFLLEKFEQTLKEAIKNLN